jgi:ABC-2 type transport system permease protein
MNPAVHANPMRSSLLRTSAIVLRHFYLIKGSIARLFPLFAWVAIDIVLWGFITKYLNATTSASFDFVPVLLGAVLLWDFFSRVMHGVTMAFLEDVWARNFLNIFATPLSIAEYVTGLVLSSIATSSIGLVVMLILASFAFGLSFLSYGLMIYPFLFVLFLFGIALGIVGSAIVLRLGPASEWFIWPIPALLAPFAGVFYPVSTLPKWMQVIAYALPPSYVFEGLRQVVNGRDVAVRGLALSAAMAVLYIMAASWLFVSVYRYAVRTGLIARYSAESIS